MFTRQTVYLILLTLQVRGQLDVGDRIIPETPPPPAQSDEEPVDQEAVKALTRRIQSRDNVADRNEHASENHPGKKYFEQVSRRLLSAPQELWVMVSLSEEVQQQVILQNVLLNIQTPAGILPIQWSEIHLMEKKGDQFHFQLRGGDTLTGGLEKRDLYLERNDASEWIVPVSDVVRLEVLRSEK